MHKIAQLPISNQQQLIQALLQLSKEFSYCSLLNSNSFKDEYGKYEILCGMGARSILKQEELLKKDFSNDKDWVFFHLNYDLKNIFENLQSKNEDHISFPDLVAFVPEVVFSIKRGENELQIFSNDMDVDFVEKFKKLLHQNHDVEPYDFPKVKAKISKPDYIRKILNLKGHIQRGDIYEANFCQEFYAEKVDLLPEQSYIKLNTKSPAPFSAFYKNNKKFLLSASPERFLAKLEQQLISQPIKGTLKRGKDPKEDEELKIQLRNDLKEQTENVMIVDVVRNDLSRIASRNSVEVKELFGIYSFPQVHQMISTVTCELKKEVDFGAVLKATFPMASMTGAPKISAMKILDDAEESKRNLYSGSVGYISPEGDFDLNVVIRSLLYNQENKYLSYSVGGAITIMSDPEKEYEECLLKAKAIFEK